MIFALSSLSKENYQLLQKIFSRYEDGELCDIPMSKQSKPDCKGSNFKGILCVLMYTSEAKLLNC